jgi:hypothetical protein
MTSMSTSWEPLPSIYRSNQEVQCNLVQNRHQLDPSERNARRVRDVISLLEEYGGMA